MKYNSFERENSIMLEESSKQNILQFYKLSTSDLLYSNPFKTF